MGGLLGRKRISSSFSSILLLYLLVIGFASALEYSRNKQANNFTLEMIKKHVDAINKPAVMSIESPDGDIIDCINIRKQLAFDHPSLKKHKLQLVPSEMPGRVNDVSDSRKEEWVARQVWHQNRTSCLKGTVPIRRTTVDDVLKAGSLSGYGKKKHPNTALATHSSNAPLQVNLQNHEYATMTSRPSDVVYGATAALNVWNPKVELDDEFSLSQLWVVAGSYEGGDLNTLEAGWHVDPQIFDGDRSTRLFVYWTADAYQSTGCYNTLCSPGFVQVDQSITVGAAISEAEKEITLTIFKDQKTGNWWLSYGKIAVGYWPAELFTRLTEGATVVQWGGEVINNKPNGAHTATEMGSGQFAQEGSGKASYFHSLGLVDSSNAIIQPDQSLSLIPSSPNSNCYSITVPSTAQGNNNIIFYYGGPGRNPLCP